MNSDTQPTNTSNYEKQKELNTQINNSDDLQVTGQIFGNLNQSTEQKQKLDSNLTSTSHISPLSTRYIAGNKHQTYKLVDSKQVSGFQFDKKAFLLDTYARIAASNYRRYPKRIRELAKPKKQAHHSDQDDIAVNFTLNYGRVTKTYRTEDKRN
ncbi:uncharacterized protein LOC118648897 [Monomorium pharaonis]|uniref:uncharacterized protein LOC118648897 n=1 Tax=Monomorium pharaonis TaxID=307658 RepID=UPI001746A1B2|nr:uncharacterized protein LOC118648897 [Monomorium pharaonis]